ncbi:required for excision 1-B domain-containing protein-like [Patiria miniata]|uniref:Required for excision 1-B domain-containing protein n=1 Tax=Patiria miniata TaxID=46514 RepID=A0A913Z9N2_PATMI|nr:required for excision 1-B domain-containing protein-like [Patiria miniata]
MVEAGPAQLIKELFSLQEERIKIYKQLDQAHIVYLDTSPDYDFPVFRQVVHDCTEEFSRVSKRVIGIEEQFREALHKTEIARLIRDVQENEQSKLELTGLLQIAKQRLQDDPGDMIQDEVTQLKHKRNATISQIAELLQDIRYEAEDFLT